MMYSQHEGDWVGLNQHNMIIASREDVVSMRVWEASLEATVHHGTQELLVNITSHFGSSFILLNGSR